MAVLRTSFGGASGDHVSDHTALHARYNAGELLFPTSDPNTDRTGDLQTAIDNYASKGITLAPGQYRLATGLTLPRSTRLFGYGATLVCDAGITALTLTANLSYNQSTLEGFTVSGGAIGIDLPPSAYQHIWMRLKDIQLADQSSIGLYVHNPMYFADFDRLRCSGAGDYGMLIDPPGLCNDNRFEMCSFTGCGVGAAITWLHFSAFRNSDIEGNDHEGLIITDCARLRFDTTYFEANGQDETGGPYPDVTLDGTIAGMGTWLVAFDTSYPGPAGPNQGNLFINVLHPASVQAISLPNHSNYTKQIAFNDARGTVFNNIGQSDHIYTSDSVWLQGGPIVQSPDGSRWRLSVSNAGAVSATKL